jgi:hypothetical protein
MQFHLRARAKEIALGNPEEKRITNLPGGTGDDDVDGRAAVHRE